MDCHVIRVDQKSESWDELRRGRITASRLGDVMAKPTTKRYTQYRQELALARLGVEEEASDAPWFEHGRAMEPRAISAYEWKYGVRMIHDVFLIHHKYEWLGCSPDLMADDFSEGVEIKCRKLFKNYMEARDMNRIAPEYRFQIQGAMWLTGLPSWFACNYYENERDGSRKISRIEVERDDKLIADMNKRCVILNREVEAMMGGFK